MKEGEERFMQLKNNFGSEASFFVTSIVTHLTLSLDTFSYGFSLHLENCPYLPIHTASNGTNSMPTLCLYIEWDSA